MCSYLGSQHFLFKMASQTRSYERSSSRVSLDKLKDLMKEHMGDGPPESWLEADDKLTLSLFLQFFIALAHETTRVNPVAVAGCAQSLWKFDKKTCNLLGNSLHKAFSYVKLAGDKAVDGTMLSSEVRQVYYAMTGREPGQVKTKEEPAGINPGEASAVKVEPSGVKVEASAIKVEPSAVQVKASAVKVEPSWSVKAEHCQVKAELCQVKQELAGQSGISCLVSPAKILQLYQGNFSAADTPRKCLKVDLHVWIYMYICIYVFDMCGYIYMYICIYVFYMCGYIYICIYVYMYICIYVYMYMYIKHYTRWRRSLA